MYKRLMFLVFVLAGLISLIAQENDSLPEKYVPKVIIEADWGDGPGEFGYLNTNTGGLEDRGPMAIFVRSGEISILDNVNNRICVYSTDGIFIKTIKLSLSNNIKVKDTLFPEYVVARINLNPYSLSLARDKTGWIYILGEINYWDTKKKRSKGLQKAILKYDSLGSFISIVFRSPIKKDTILILPGHRSLEQTKNGKYNIRREHDTLRRIEGIEIYPKLSLNRDTLSFYTEKKNKYKINKNNGKIFKKIKLSENKTITLAKLADDRFLKEYPNSIKTGISLNKLDREFLMNARILLRISPVITSDKEGDFYEMVWSPDYKERGLEVIKWEKIK